jgi:hypothetical protein
MRDAEKKPKIGPREQQLRDMREARIAKNKQLIDKNAKEIAATLRTKVKAGVKGRATKVVTKVKAKRGRTGR